MTFGPATFGAGFIAGVLSTLSPCVLPLLPIIVGTAVTAHRLGPLALAAGVAGSFALLGTTVAYAGAAIDLDPGLLREIGAAMLGAFGVVLLSGTLQRRFAAATSGIGERADALLSRLQPAGAAGQALIGLLLGVVWSPCVGPTLGAAIALASQGRDLGPIMLLMGIFGFGAALPLLGVGWLGRRALASRKNLLLRTGQLGKAALGLAFVAVSIIMLTGWDQRAESWLVAQSPAWLTALTTRF